ncbi:protein G12-like [Topomyia yanbarensis]|uniref:protein G12-like n=1 Tax=Topomyia yanbarensis TaxID=2498891 RepID=UPI00273ADD20|nr:protein G12-like [Topomyia yanbarensis]
MKLLSIISFALVASVALGVSVQIPTNRSLQDDFDEFVALLPTEEIINVALRYVLVDKEVQAAVQYITGPEFSTIWDQVFALKEIRDILDYLEEAGVHVYDALNDLANLIGVKPIKPSTVEARSSVSIRGLNGMIEEVLSLLPKEELLALFEQKLTNSADFKAFFDKLRSTDIQKLVELFNSSAELQSLFRKLREYGVDVDEFLELVKGFFDWGY